jgi:hypothetical protein
MLDGLIGVIDSGLNLASNVVTRMNLKDRTKYIDRVRALKLEYLAENGKPDGQRIDSKVEALRDQLFIEIATMNAAIASGVMQDSGGGA